MDITDGSIKFQSNFLGSDNSYYETLLETTPWQQEKISMYGKTYLVPRKTCWYSDEGIDYNYSGIASKSNPWNSVLLEIKTRVESELCEEFNSVLLNYYKDGNDKVSWHSDNEKCFGDNPTIASLSLGHTRRFDIKRKDKTGSTIKTDLCDGSLIVMSGEFQKYWLHQIPVQKKVTQGRINLTFRKVS